MEDVILKILPDSKGRVQDLCIVLKDLEANTFEDLPLVRVNDLTSIPTTKPVCALGVSGELE